MLGVGGNRAEGESDAYGRRDESPVEVHNHSLIASAARPGPLPGIEQHEPVKKADEISMSNDLANGNPPISVVFPGSRSTTHFLCPLYKGRLSLPA
jgi:hypothetical protein